MDRKKGVDPFPAILKRGCTFFPIYDPSGKSNFGKHGFGTKYLQNKPVVSVGSQETEHRSRC